MHALDDCVTSKQTDKKNPIVEIDNLIENS
jgi:hypothetical protein